MGSDPLDQHNPVPILRLHNQPVFVAIDIEDHPVVRQEAGAWISVFYILRARPLRVLDVHLPRVQRSARISVVALKGIQQEFAKQPHVVRLVP